MAKKKHTPSPSREGNPETPAVNTESKKPRFVVTVSDVIVLETEKGAEALDKIAELKKQDEPEITLTDNKTTEMLRWYKEAHQKNYRVESTKA